MGARSDRTKKDAEQPAAPVWTYVEGERLTLHKGSGQAYLYLPDEGGRKRRFFCGKYFEDEERRVVSRRMLEYAARWIREYRVLGGPPLSVARSSISVAQLIERFLKHVEDYYGDSPQVVHYRSAVSVLVELYGSLPAAEFGPLKMAAARDAMVETDRWSRGTLNAHLGRIRRAFRWGVANEVVPAGVYEALRAVEGVRRGRTKARESKKVRPVGEEDVRAVLPYVSRQVAAMIQIQLFSGMRPGEVVTMRPRDVDRSETIWRYNPQSHKTAHLNREREIFLGPRAQGILTPYMLRSEDVYLFSPREAEAERLAVRHDARRTPITAGNAPGTNRQLNPKRTLRGHYDVAAYRRAIRRACEKAGVQVWSPHQLRHSAGTEIRRRHGIEAARIMLGHADAGVTQIYAEADRTTARKIAGEIG